jgi:hypothetical protein
MKLAHVNPNQFCLQNLKRAMVTKLSLLNTKPSIGIQNTAVALVFPFNKVATSPATVLSTLIAVERLQKKCERKGTCIAALYWILLQQSFLHLRQSKETRAFTILPIISLSIKNATLTYQNILKISNLGAIN